ncbi:MAG: hypothetical protein PHI98_01235 [Eubacteriales bacterium]|nr:hypothetical protein [Eubacteriales bacterium]
MNYHPILFSTPMVQANLAGKKAMTRRPIKLKYCNTHIGYSANRKHGCPLCEIQNDVEGETHGTNPDGSSWRKLLAMREVEPQYKVGDILWVRETWLANTMGVFFRADWTDGACQGIDFDKRWCPSIYMPKDISRIFLRVTGVRAEQVQDISPLDVLAEGVTIPQNDEWDCEASEEAMRMFEFSRLWDACYAKPAPCKEKGAITCYVSYPWDDVYETREYKGLPWYIRGNPWVWVYTVERVDKPEGWPLCA